MSPGLLVALPVPATASRTAWLGTMLSSHAHNDADRIYNATFCMNDGLHLMLCTAAKV